MKLEPHIRPVSGLLLSYIGLSRAKGFLLGTQIYLRPEIYHDLLGSKPNPRNVGILIHENTHHKRMRSMGLLRFGLKYLFSRSGRLEEELIAYGKQMKYLKSKKLNYDLDKIAKNLSGWVYIWCTSYNVVRPKLQKIWDEA